MAAFLGPLLCEEVDSTRARLHEPFSYQTDVAPVIITVPAGFVTDFSSVPRLPIAYLLVGGKARRAAVTHDWLYELHGRPDGIADANGDGIAVPLDQPALSRRQCDAIFYEAARLSHSMWDAWIMWAGVRVGGWWAWGT